jgi:hypothetical protein
MSVLWKHFKPSLMSAGKARAYPNGALWQVFILSVDRASACPGGAPGLTGRH